MTTIRYLPINNSTENMKFQCHFSTLDQLKIFQDIIATRHHSSNKFQNGGGNKLEFFSGCDLLHDQLFKLLLETDFFKKEHRPSLFFLNIKAQALTLQALTLLRQAQTNTSQTSHTRRVVTQWATCKKYTGRTKI